VERSAGVGEGERDRDEVRKGRSEEAVNGKRTGRVGGRSSAKELWSPRGV